MNIGTENVITRRRGSKYTSGQDVAEIAKCIRADAKAATRTGELPEGLKLSVRVSRFSGGSSIDILVTAAPGLLFRNLLSILEERAAMNAPRQHPRYTLEGRVVLASIEQIAQDYQRCESDTQTDYHNTNFFLDVNYDRTLVAAYDAMFQPANDVRM
jgi:hypothetical protein